MSKGADSGSYLFIFPPFFLCLSKVFFTVIFFLYTTHGIIRIYTDLIGVSSMNFFEVKVKTDDGVETHFVRSKNKKNALTNVLTNIVKAENVHEASCQKVAPTFEPIPDESK
jgi:hypothetical protein